MEGCDSDGDDRHGEVVVGDFISSSSLWLCLGLRPRCETSFSAAALPVSEEEHEDMFGAPEGVLGC